MADQNTKDINTVNNITSIDANDYLFVSDQGSALRKANSNVVSKYAVETYTTTLGGVNNKTVQSAINDLNSKLGRLITSGSLHDILTPGIYYISSSVTDQPVQQDGYGGTYIVSSTNENTLVGIYISMYDKSIWSITKLNATWTHTQMAKTAWKLVGTATGNNELSLPSTNWNELRVIVYLTSTPNEGRVGYNITRQEIADTTGTPFYVNGRFPSSGGQAQIAVSGAYVKLDTYMVGTTNRVADATIRVYYR